MCFAKGKDAKIPLASGEYFTVLGQESPQLAKFSGDLMCTSVGARPVPQRGVALLQYRDRNPTGTKTGSDLLEECAADLSRQPPSVGSASDYLESLREAYGEGGPRATRAYDDVAAFYGEHTCFEAGQFFVALNGPSTPQFRLRLLQQWVDLHSFLAVQGLEQYELAQTEAGQITAQNTQAGIAAPTNAPYDPALLLARINQGWALLLARAAAASSRTLGAQAHDLRAPDYRKAYGGELVFPYGQLTGADYQQPTGLAPALFEALEAEMKVLTRHLRDVGLATYGGAAQTSAGAARDAALAAFGKAMRYALAVEDVATQLHRVAFETPMTCSVATAAQDCAGFEPAVCSVTPGMQTGTCAWSAWSDRWDSARMAYLQARAEAVTQAVQLANGANPLGIDENDLPLFFGDPNGTNSQFFASSDYLMNTWAVSAVASAQDALGQAREAWVRQRDSRIMDENAANDRERRLEAIATQYGEIISKACGLDAELLPAEVLSAIADDRVSLDTCHIVPNEQCQETEERPSTPSWDDGMAFGACYMEKQQAAITENELTNDPCYLHFMRHPDATDGSLVAWLGRSGWVVRRSWTLHGVSEYYDFSSSPPGWHALDPYTLTDLPLRSKHCSVQWFEQARHTVLTSAHIAPDDVNALRAACEEELGMSEPVNLSRLPMPASCYRGELGVGVLRMLGAQQDVELAKMNWASLRRTHSIHTDYCLYLSANAQIIADEGRRYAREQERLAEAQGELQQIATVMGGVTSSLTTDGVGMITAVGTAALQGDINELSLAMQRAQNEHAQFLQNISAEQAVMGCQVEADKVRAGFDTAKALIERRATDFDAARIELANAYRAAKSAAEAGHAALQREADRTVGAYSFHYWFDEKVARYRREMEWARRLVYLTMRAVEYEFQQSLPLRATILTATHPDQLESSLRALQAELATRTINRRRPDDASIVLSLREDVMGLRDRDDAGPGERAYSAALTFRSRLWDERYAVRDKNGQWIGQGIPFDVGPQGPLVNRCGERLWRVTATVQGDGLSDVQPGASVYLLKQNTFMSQWCDGHSDGSAFQTGAVQPSRNLFKGGPGAMTDESQGYSVAALYPWFNVSRSEFYKESYRDGASEELAGRGLYGHYILLFPRELLSGATIPPVNGETGAAVPIERFPLSRVEDVLLRFDYLSVDNLPQIQQ